MKICYLAPANSIHSQRWISFFGDAGHEVQWISLHASAFDKHPGVRYHECDLSKSRSVLKLVHSALKVRRYIKEFGPEIIHVQSAGIYGLFGLVCSRKIPMVLTAWGSDIVFGGQQFSKRFLVRKVLRRADLITTDAVHMIEAMKKLGASSGKMHIIQFGVDTKRFRPQPKSQELRSQLGIADRPTIISMRNFERVYDIETLIRAVPLVLGEEPKAEFLLLGRGPLKEALEILVKELGVAANVHFLGHLPVDQVPTLITSSDIYVSTSLSDAGLASSTQEAMACCTPVVITDSAENRNWVEDGVNGLVVPVKSPKILAEKICSLLKDKELGAQMGAKGRGTILERSDYYTEMAKVGTLLKSAALRNDGSLS